MGCVTRMRKKVELRVTSGPDEPNVLRVVVRDNGCGFGPDAVRSGRGIRNMQVRADTLGANFRIELADPGTRIALEVPLPTEPQLQIR